MNPTAPATLPRSSESGAAFLSPFPPIADYAFLSDCENNCLLAPSGAVEWMCLPHPHDPTVFATLLDRSAGSFRLGPADCSIPSSRRYVPGTNVLETTWQTRTGWLVVTDFLAVGPWHRTADRSQLHRRTPSDYDARHVLVRIARCVHGVVDLALKCGPAFDYGREDARWEYAGADYDVVTTCSPGQIQLSLGGNLRLGIEGRNVLARHRLPAGESSFVSLGWSGRALPSELEEVTAWLGETEGFWRAWLDAGELPDHPGRGALERSALTLKGLSYTPTGALLAAATSSLPEQPGGQRNWDYRYSWVRDSAFAMWGLHALGYDAEAEDFLAFLGDMLEAGNAPAEHPPAVRAAQLAALPGLPWSNPHQHPSGPRPGESALTVVWADGDAAGRPDEASRAHRAAQSNVNGNGNRNGWAPPPLPEPQPCLQVLYAVNGEPLGPETILDHLSGYEHAAPVRIGNAAVHQDQHDIWGTIVDCVYQHVRNRDSLSERNWRIVVRAVEAALDCWDQPDRGIWEVRGAPRHFTLSKAMCWLAAARGSQLAALRADPERAARWMAAAEAIRADVCASGVDGRGRFTQYYGSVELDASLLLLPLIGFLPAEDPRIVATVLAIADELTEDGMVLRYRTETTDDGLGEPEATFTTCSFWLVSALVEIGELTRARELCERLLAAASPLGLYAEEIDPATGRQLGNFPQALTHLALIDAVMHVVRADERRGDLAGHLL